MAEDALAAALELLLDEAAAEDDSLGATVTPRKVKAEPEAFLQDQNTQTLRLLHRERL